MADFGDLEINAEIRRIHEQSPVRPKLKFFYVGHDLKDAGDVWQKAKDCDVILLEMPGLAPGRRQELESQIALATRSNRSPDDQERRDYFLSRRNKNFSTAITAYCIENGKEFHLVDAEQENESERLDSQSIDKFQEAKKYLLLGNIDGALENYIDYIQLYSQSAAIRERLVMSQIMELEESRQNEWNGKRVGIIQGLEHTPTYHAYKKTAVDTDTEKILPTSTYLFNPVTELSRRIRLRPSTKINDIDYKRGFIGEIIIGPEFEKNEDEPTIDLFRKFDVVLRGMADKDIADYWERLGDIAKQTAGTRVGLYERKKILDEQTRNLAKQIIEQFS